MEILHAMPKLWEAYSFEKKLRGIIVILSAGYFSVYALYSLEGGNDLNTSTLKKVCLQSRWLANYTVPRSYKNGIYN